MVSKLGFAVVFILLCLFSVAEVESSDSTSARVPQKKGSGRVFSVHTIDVPAESNGTTAEVAGKTSRALPSGSIAVDSARGSMVITSIPDGAGIIINEYDVGTTPYLKDGFQPGAYNVVVAFPGYISCTTSVAVQPGSTVFVNNYLRLQQGRLFIVSTPEAAYVSVNDSIVGKTPWRCSIPAGPCRLNLTLDGYEPWHNTFTVSSKLNDTITAHLEPVKFSQVNAGGKAGSRRRALRITIGTAGVASAVAGAIAFNRMNAIYNQWTNVNSKKGNDSYLANRDRYYFYRNSTITGLSVAGICGIALGATFIF